MYIAAKAGRHIWRDLEAILAVEQDCGSLALRPFLNAFVYPQKVEWFRIWVGGAVKGKNEAKYDDLAEWRADIPSVCVMDRTLTAYHAGIASAEEARKLLGGALGKYSKPDHDIPGKDPSQIPYEWAESLFWHGLDRRFAVLLAAVEANTDAKFAAWHAVIRDAMHAAYDQTCPHETPRQIQAYARGLQVLEAWKGGAHGQAD
jgi:hypothetical protein